MKATAVSTEATAETLSPQKRRRGFLASPGGGFSMTVASEERSLGSSAPADSLGMTNAAGGGSLRSLGESWPYVKLKLRPLRTVALTAGLRAALAG